MATKEDAREDRGNEQQQKNDVAFRVLRPPPLSNASPRMWEKKWRVCRRERNSAVTCDGDGQVLISGALRSTMSAGEQRRSSDEREKRDFSNSPPTLSRRQPKKESRRRARARASFASGERRGARAERESSRVSFLLATAAAEAKIRTFGRHSRRRDERAAAFWLCRRCETLHHSAENFQIDRARSIAISICSTLPKTKRKVAARMQTAANEHRQIIRPKSQHTKLRKRMRAKKLPKRRSLLQTNWQWTP